MTEKLQILVEYLKAQPKKNWKYDSILGKHINLIGITFSIVEDHLFVADKKGTCEKFNSPEIKSFFDELTCYAQEHELARREEILTSILRQIGII